MELRVLKYFLAVVEEKNITRAAKKLHLTQPTLSRQMMQLEEELGIILFERGKNKIILTEDGMFLKKRAQEILHLTEKTKVELNKKEIFSGEISIGCGESTSMSILSKNIASFSQKYPLVQFHIFSATADEIKGKLEKEIIDIGLLMEPVEVKKYAFLRMKEKERWGILAISYPALAIYNSGISMYRSLGDTKTAMYISVLANVINVIGNIIGVFVLKASVAGVVYPSLIARVFSAVIITILCFQKKNKVFYRWKWIFSWDGTMIKNILKIAIPNGVENGIFQLVKVALSSVVALFGTYQIAANGVAQSMWSLAALAGLAMAPVFITVIGQCMGQGNIKAAEYYFNKLLKITMLLSIVWNVFTFFLTPVVLHLYALEEETKKMVLMLVLIHNVFNALTYPFMGALSNGLRAAGDVRYTMYVSIVATVIVRLALSYIFGVIFQWGVIGIAIAMCCDWIVKAVVFAWRLKSGKWKRFKVV